MLQLLDLNKNKIAGLTEYKDLCIESVLKTGDKTLSFLYSNKSKYYDEIVEESYIRTKTNEYVVKEKNLQSNYTTFICKLNVEDIEGKEWDRFESVEQTIINALNLGIAGTGWTIGKTECDIKKKRTIRVTNCSSWDIIQQIKKTYRVEIEFDTINKKINLYEHIGTDKGTYFVDSLNLKSLNVQGNSYDYVTRIIPVGKDGITIEDINNGKKYVENYQYTNKIKTLIWKDERYTIKENLKNDAIAKLDEISKPYRAYSLELINLAKLNDKYKDVLDYSLGDTITILSKENNIKEKQRIVKLKEYPQDHTRDTVEIANTILRFEDIQQENQETTDTLNNVTLDNGTLDGEAFEDGGISSKKIENFKANVIEAAEIHVIKGDIQDLNVAVLKAGQAIITKVDTAQLNALESKLQHALIGKADVNELNVAVERVGILEGKTLSVENQLAGNLTTKNFKANSITAGSGIIAEGAIGDAEISSLSVNKLEAGDITTSKHKIVSADGTIEIVGNQILINRNNVNRVILGEYRKQDNTTDYGLLIRAKDGKTIMLDGEGVHNAGITDGAINNNKVADNANISGNKLDINSVIREVNNKGTETIKGTKVTVGDRTLDVELSTQKNTITEHDKELSNQKATINALDNAIKLKVDNQTFTQSTSTINNNINNLNSDLVSKINSSLNNAKSYADSKKQEAINSSNSHADAKANESLNNAKAYTNAQVNTVNNNLSKATSEINILKNQISTKVGQVDIDRSIQDIKIGGRNLILGSNKMDANYSLGFSNEFTPSVVQGKTYTISMYIDVVNARKNSQDRIGCEMVIDYVDGSHDWFGCWYYINNGTTFKGRIKDTFTFQNKPVKTINWVHIYTELITADNIKAGKLKLEEGNKATDWIPSPEDTDKLIVDNIKVVTDKINDVSTKFIQAKDSLQASVNSLNSTTQTITTNLTKTNNSLNSKIDTAKIDAINQAVNSSNNYVNNQVNILNNNKEDKNNRVIFARGTGNDYPANSYVKIGNIPISNRQGRGLRIIALNPITLKQAFLQDYDTFGSEDAKVSFVNKINELNNGDYIIIITSQDASYPLHPPIKIALEKIGATLFYDGEGTYREAYALIGKSKLGKGNGIEMFIPRTANDKRFAEVAVKVDENGNLLGVSKSNLQSYSDYISTTKANDAKNQAINSANSHADSKANEALNNAKTYTNAQITTVNTRVSNAESSINVLKNQISTKVSQSDIDRTVNNIKIGGRNLLINSPSVNNKITYTSESNDGFKYFNNIYANLIKGRTYTISYQSNGEKRDEHKPNDGQDGVSIWLYDNKTNYLFLGKGKTFIAPADGKYILRTNIYRVGKTYSFWNIKVEEGTIPTDWTPAPEDLQQEIKDNITTVTTKISNVESNLKQTKDSLQASVEAVSVKANNVSNSLNETKNDLLNKLNTAIDTSKKYADEVAVAKADLARQQAIANADGKITAEEQKRIQQAQDNLNIALNKADKAKAEAVDLSKQYANTQLNNAKDYTNNAVANIKSQITLDLNGIKSEVAKKTDKGSIISAINQSAEKITISASKISLNGATTFANSTGLKAIEVRNNSILFYDWEGSERKDPVGEVYSTRTNRDARKPGIAIGNKKGSSFDIIYQDGNTNKSYMTFDKDNILGNGFPITFNEDVSLRSYILWLGKTKRNSMYESDKGDFTIRTAHGLKVIDKDNLTTTADLDANQTIFYKWDHEYSYAEFRPDEFRFGNGKGSTYFWTEKGNSNIYTGSHINLRVQGDLSVNGKKNRIVKDTIYGDLMLNAIESTECWFTDMLIEQSRTDSNGDCIIWFDNKFLQTVNTRFKYKIDVTPIGEFASNGKLTYVRVVEKTDKYFKVRGTPNTLFDWTITAKQKGYERDRLEVLKAS